MRWTIKAEPIIYASSLKELRTHPNGITIEFPVNVLGCARSIIVSWAVAYKKLKQCQTYPVGISTNRGPVSVYTAQLQGMEKSREPASSFLEGSGCPRENGPKLPFSCHISVNHIHLLLTAQVVCIRGTTVLCLFCFYSFQMRLDRQAWQDGGVG